jgi:hypothetical protein
MCLLCEQEAFFQAYTEYMARKRAGAADDASAFKAEAVDNDGDLERAGDTLGATSLKWGEVGSRSDPGEGDQPNRELVTPSPQPSPPRGEGVRSSLSHEQVLETNSAALRSTISVKGAS